jgi:hypothetical protein
MINISVQELDFKHDSTDVPITYIYIYVCVYGHESSDT